MALLSPLALIGGIGVPELLILFAIVLLLFGYSRLPQLGKGLGEGIRNFRHGLKNQDEKPEPPSSEPIEPKR